MTTATITLTDFILQRIAEDEAVAREALDGDEFPWLPAAALKGAAPKFIARNDPARVLAECEAKRAIVARCERDMVADGESVSGYDVIAHTDALARDVLEFLALPYADHADYNPEWRP